MKPIELIQDQTLFDINKPGIYMIHCPIDGKVYIGQTAVSIKRRWSCHRSDLRKGNHDNPYLQNVYRKYKALSYFILENCIENLNEREGYWASQIEKEFLMNCSPTGKSNGGRKKKIQEEQYPEIIELLKQNKTFDEIASQYGVCREVISQVNKKTIQRKDLRSSMLIKRNKAMAKYSEQQIEKVRELISKGKTGREISTLTSISESYISQIKKRKEFQLK